MKYSSFGDLLWSSTLKSWGVVIAFAGSIASILVWYLNPNDTVSLKWFLLVIIFGSYVAIVLARTAWTAFELRPSGSFKVRIGQNPPKGFENEAVALLLLDPTPALANDAVVAIYFQENGFERLGGFGRVFNIQDDGRIQILVVDDLGFEAKLNGIRNNSPDELKSLIVKSMIPWKTFVRP